MKGTEEHEKRLTTNQAKTFLSKWRMIQKLFLLFVCLSVQRLVRNISLKTLNRKRKQNIFDGIYTKKTFDLLKSHRFQFHPFISSQSTVRRIQLKFSLPESYSVLKISRGGNTSIGHFLHVITTSFIISFFFYKKISVHLDAKENTRSFSLNYQRAWTSTIQSIILKLLEYFKDIHHWDRLLFIQLWKAMSP